MALSPDDVKVVVLDRDELRRDWRARLTRPSVGVALAVVGAIAIIVGYLGVAHETLVAKQIPYLVSGGIGGMVLVAVGAFLLGTDDVRRQLERVEHLESMVGDLHRALLQVQGQAATLPSGPAVAAPATNGSSSAHSEGGLVALRQAKSYHRTGCTMVAGKAAQPIGAADIASRGLAPCALCDPIDVTV